MSTRPHIHNFGALAEHRQKVAAMHEAALKAHPGCEHLKAIQPLDFVGHYIIGILPGPGMGGFYALYKAVRKSEIDWHRSLTSAQKQARVNMSKVKLSGQDIRVCWEAGRERGHYRNNREEGPDQWVMGTLLDLDAMAPVHSSRLCRVQGDDGELYEMRLSELHAVPSEEIVKGCNAAWRKAHEAERELNDLKSKIKDVITREYNTHVDNAMLKDIRRRQKAGTLNKAKRTTRAKPAKRR
jgi:hypothetical protein